MISQANKKAMKHSARMPRTAGLRTLTELSTEMTKAGLDPSRIEERAHMIAKVRGVGVVSKRKRDDDGDMDVDGEGEGGEEWMEVDEEEDATPVKRRKSNTGTAVTAKAHQPRTNRQLGGLRDESVRTPNFYFFSHFSHVVISTASQQDSQATESRPAKAQ